MLSWDCYGFILVIIFLYLGWLQLILVPVVLWFGRIFNIQFF